MASHSTDSFRKIHALLTTSPTSADRAIIKLCGPLAAHEGISMQFRDLFAAILLFASPLCAGQSSQPAPHAMAQMEHDGFMQGGMHH